MCPPLGEKHRVEIHVTADDPRPKDLAEPDRGVDETAQFEVELLAPGGFCTPPEGPGVSRQLISWATAERSVPSQVFIQGLNCSSCVAAGLVACSQPLTRPSLLPP